VPQVIGKHLLDALVSKALPHLLWHRTRIRDRADWRDLRGFGVS
jgi:hypothetical protein